MGYDVNESVKVEDGVVKFAKERLQDIVGGYDLDGADMSMEEYENTKNRDEFASIVEKEVTDTSRWSVHYRCVFELNGNYYLTHFREGATEIQDEEPYEYEGDFVEVTEVVPQEVTVIKYVAKEAK